jgi:hypothetical protein
MSYVHKYLGRARPRCGMVRIAVAHAVRHWLQLSTGDPRRLYENVTIM